MATIASAPILGHAPVPIRVRVALALILAFIATSFAPVSVPVDSPHALAYTLRETLIGAVEAISRALTSWPNLR